MTDRRTAEFHSLHAAGCFVMPNPWDAGSARALEQLGFPALATTSAGLAWTLGRADTQVGISVGGTLARTAWGGFLQAAQEIVDAGTFSGFSDLPMVDARFSR